MATGETGFDDVAAFFREVMEQDSQRAHRCHEFLLQVMSGN